jgi:hypothetical protein
MSLDVVSSRAWALSAAMRTADSTVSECRLAESPESMTAFRRARWIFSSLKSSRVPFLLTTVVMFLPPSLAPIGLQGL